MRVAIVGAGLAGLACAHELERLGVLPEIFERQRAVGKPALLVEPMLQLLHPSPRQEIFAQIRGELGLPLDPLHPIRRIRLQGPVQTAWVQGRFGASAIRGHDDRSLERQLLVRLAAPVRYGTRPDLWELRREFDWVVVATGDEAWSRQFSPWTESLPWSIRGAVVTGAFDPDEQQLFLDPQYAKTGYALLSPVDERRAVAGVWVPGVSGDEAERYWEAFLQAQVQVCTGSEQPFRCQVTVGRPASCRIGNLLLVGQAGGFREPLGLTGGYASLASGVYAARQIVLGDRSLDRFFRQFRVHYQRLWRLRQAVEAWSGEEMDRFVQAVHQSGPLLTTAPLQMADGSAWLAEAQRPPNPIA